MRPVITIVGGYGAIGRIVASRLYTSGCCHVVICGRNHAKAEAFSNMLGSEARAASLDVESGDASPLAGSHIVINATAPSWKTSFPLAKLALSVGADVVDIGGYDLLIEGLASDAPAITAAGRRVIATAGWIPGVSEVLTYHVVEEAQKCSGRVRKIEILCGARDHWSEGSAADMLWHLLERTGAGWYEHGRWRSVPAMRGWATRRLPAPIGCQLLMMIPNPQLAALANQVQPTRLVTLLGLIGWRTMRAMGRARSLGRKAPDRAARLLAESIAAEAGADPIGVCEVHAECDNAIHLGRIITRDNLGITAAATVVTAQTLLNGHAVAPGVQYLGQAVAPRPFLDALAALGFSSSVQVV